MVTRVEHTVLGKNRMASGREEDIEHVLLVLVATKTVFCWQCFSDLGFALIVYFVLPMSA